MSISDATLRVTGLTLRAGRRDLCEGLSLSLAPNERRAVRGPSGAGKTLLLRQVAGLDPYCGQALSLGGCTPDELGWPAWRAEVAYVPQRPPASDGTAAELFAELCALKSHRRRRLDSPTELALDWGLQPDRWRQPWNQLSGGERHRALLAMAVCRDPTVLLLDEPTASLDPEATAAVEASLEGRAALWVTHDAAQAARLGGEPIVLGQAP